MCMHFRYLMIYGDVRQCHREGDALRWDLDEVIVRFIHQHYFISPQSVQSRDAGMKGPKIFPTTDINAEIFQKREQIFVVYTKLYKQNVTSVSSASLWKKVLERHCITENDFDSAYINLTQYYISEAPAQLKSAVIFSANGNMFVICTCKALWRRGVYVIWMRTVTYIMLFESKWKMLTWLILKDVYVSRQILRA